MISTWVGSIISSTQSSVRLLLLKTPGSLFSVNKFHRHVSIAQTQGFPTRLLGATSFELSIRLIVMQLLQKNGVDGFSSTYVLKKNEL